MCSGTEVIFDALAYEAPSVPSDRLINVLIAGLCILVLAAGSASIANPVVIQGEEEPDERLYKSPEVDDREPGTVGDANGFIFGYGEPISICVPFLNRIDVIAAIILAAIAFGALLWVLTNGIITAAMFAGFGPIIVIGWRALTIGCEAEEEEDLVPENVTSGLEHLVRGDGNGTVQQMMQVATDPIFLFGGLVLVGLVAFAFVLLSDEEGDEEEIDEEPVETTGEQHFDESAIARIAGEAADRIESDDSGAGSLENTVYEAWREMTGYLELDSPETSTPGEFASEAIRMGMDPEHVMALTGLFEEVRYGDRPVTAERERRAVDVLREIERSYQPGDAA